MTRTDLISNIAKKLNISFKVSEIYLNTLLETITEELVKGKKIKLVNFGIFEVVKRAPRKGHNPHTKEIYSIPACNAATFKPGKELKELINR